MLSSMCEPLSQLDGSEADPGYRVRNYWRENFTNLCLIKEKIRIHINLSIECFFFEYRQSYNTLGPADKLNTAR